MDDNTRELAARIVLDGLRKVAEADVFPPFAERAPGLEFADDLTKLYPAVGALGGALAGGAIHDLRPVPDDREKREEQARQKLLFQFLGGAGGLYASTEFAKKRIPHLIETNVRHPPLLDLATGEAKEGLEKLKRRFGR